MVAEHDRFWHSENRSEAFKSLNRCRSFWTDSTRWVWADESTSEDAVRQHRLTLWECVSYPETFLAIMDFGP